MREVVTDIHADGYFNRVNLTVRIYEGMPMGEPAEVFALQLGAVRIGEIELREEFESLLLNHPYMMSAERSATRWGGGREPCHRGSHWQGGGDSGGLGRAEGAWPAPRQPGLPSPRTDEQEAAGHAAMLVGARYSVDTKRLNLATVELRTDGGATVVLKVGDSAEQFDVDIEIIDGLLVCGRIKHILG